MSESRHFSHNIQPLPGEEKYLSVIADVIGENEIDDYQSLDLAIAVNRYDQKGYKQFLGAAHRAANSFDAVDKESSQTESTRIVKDSVYRGLGFGGLLLPKLHGEAVDIRSIFEQSYADTEAETTDERQQRFELAEYSIMTGEKGIDIAGEASEGILEALAERVNPNISAQRYFKLGCGIIIAYAHQAHTSLIEHAERDDFETFKQAVAGVDKDYAWDAAFRDISKEQ